MRQQEEFQRILDEKEGLLKQREEEIVEMQMKMKKRSRGEF